MTENTAISLNFQTPNISTVVYAVQNDRLSRHIVAQLTDGSAPWSPPSGSSGFIRYLKPDGTAGFYDVDEAGNAAIVIDGSAANLTVAEQALTVPGDVYMQLNFYNADGSKLTTFCWVLRVQKSVLEDATIVSSDYYNVLSAQIAAVLNAAATLTGMTASVSGLPTGSQPTVDVTGGTDGNPYNLAFGIPAGPVGPVGPPEVPTTTTDYQSGDSPTAIPTGSWASTPPAVAPGAYLWTRTTLTYSSGPEAVYYSVARQGVDGTGYAVRHITGNITALPATFSYGFITPEHRVINCVLGTPSAVLSNLTWTTSDGNVVFSGTLANLATTTIDFDIVRVITP